MAQSKDNKSIFTPQDVISTQRSTIEELSRQSADWRATAERLKAENSRLHQANSMLKAGTTFDAMRQEIERERAERVSMTHKCLSLVTRVQELETQVKIMDQAERERRAALAGLGFTKREKRILGLN